MMRRRRDDHDALLDGSLLGFILCERLPRDEPTSRYDECMQLGREFAAEHHPLIRAQLDRHRRSEQDFGMMLDVLTDDVLAWARTRTGIDFLAHEPCPY